jgi:tripartite motif-containing protein 71
MSGRSLRPIVRLLLATLGVSLAVGATPALAAGCPGAEACPYASAQVIGTRAEGVLRFPEAVAVDTQGDVFVADQLSFVVQRFNATGQLEGEWGSYGAGAGQFGPIGGLATDAAGNVYVVDSSHNRIEKFSASGTFITAWGSLGANLGQFHFGSSTTPSQPPGGGIAVTGSYVYVADTDNNRVERFNLEGGEALQWGSLGNSPGQLHFPRGLAANAGEVLVADDDNHRFDPNGNYQASVGSLGAGAGQFDFPYGVALDAAGNAYVADNNNHRIVKLTPALTFAQAWGGLGAAPGQLDYPRALASDPAGDVYVADTANDRIQVYTTDGVLLRGWGVPGRGAGQFTAPAGLATDPTGRLLVSDTADHRIELFAPGSDAFQESWNVRGDLTEGLIGPSGIGVDPRGYVYVADTGNQRVLKLWGDDTFISEIGLSGGATLDDPGAVAVAPATGDAYVADTDNDRVLVYAPDGSLLAKWGGDGGNGSTGSGPGEFERPRALAIDPHSGDVYVADYGNDRIQKFSSNGTLLLQWGIRGGRDGRLRGPTGVAVDGRGDVYVADNGNNRIEVFDSSGHYLQKWGARGTGLGEFSQPTAVAVDCTGAVYVADTNNNRIERFNLNSPAPTGCLAPGSWPPPLDVAPVLHVSAPRRSGVLARRGLGLTVSCERGCRVLITATLATRKPKQTFKLVALARQLGAAHATKLRLRLAPSVLRRVRRALGRHLGLLAKVTIVAAGPTGRRVTLHRSYALRR